MRDYACSCFKYIAELNMSTRGLTHNDTITRHTGERLRTHKTLHIKCLTKDGKTRFAGFEPRYCPICGRKMEGNWE